VARAALPEPGGDVQGDRRRDHADAGRAAEPGGGRRRLCMARLGKNAASRRRHSVETEYALPAWIPRAASNITGRTHVKYTELSLIGKSTRILVLAAFLAALPAHSFLSTSVSHAETETLVVLDTLTPAESETPKTTSAGERAALAALYKTTEGANWKHSDNWLTESPISTWYGAFTDASGRVTGLDLSSNGLRGPISDLSALTNLARLSLSHNRLTGPIPNLSALTGLNSLDFGANKLVRTVPDLSALTNLMSLSLHSNQLTGPIPDLHALTELARLDPANNPLCLPERLSFPGSNVFVTAHLKSLDLPYCTSAGAKERAALVALYETTDGANWKRSDNWLTESPISTWYGVSTDANGRVTELFLARNGLRGPFSDLSALLP